MRRIGKHLRRDPRPWLVPHAPCRFANRGGRRSARVGFEGSPARSRAPGVNLYRSGRYRRMRPTNRPGRHGKQRGADRTAPPGELTEATMGEVPPDDGTGINATDDTEAPSGSDAD